MSFVVPHRGSGSSRPGGLRDAFRRAVNNSRKDPYLLSSRRAEQIVRILEGLVGMQLKLLLVPVMLLYFRKRRRHVTVEARRRTTGAHTTAMLVDYCLLHPFLAPLGKQLMSLIIEKSRRQCYHPDDVLLCPREPARSAGVVICTTGKLLVKSGQEGEGSMDRVMHSIRGGNSGGHAFYGDMIGLPPESETVINAPVVLGAMRVLTDLANPHLVVALTTVDAFIIPYDAVHAAVAGFTDLDEVAPWRRMGSVAKTLHHATTPRAPQESQAVSRAVSPVPALPERTVSPSSTVSPTHKVVLADPSHILIPRILVLQTQFKMNTLFLRQSWLLHSTPEDMFHVVAGKVECMTFAPGQLLVEKGKPPPGVLFLRRGVATVVGRTPSPLLSKAPTADCMYVMPGSVLGERSTVFNARSKESVAAVTFCDVWVLPKSDVERFRSDDTVNHAWNTNAVSMATQWLQNIRTLERTRLLNRRAREEEARLFEDTGNGYSKKRSLLDVQSSAVSSPSLEGTPLALLPMSTQRIIAALKTVSYLANAPLELLAELADAASPRVFLPQCAITTMSEWADALFVLTMGTATVQHGLTARQPPPNCSWVYRAGSCVGLECVVEHRSLFPVCSVTMVEAWSLPRGYLRERLAAHGYLQAAEHDAERVLSDLRLLLAHRTNIPRPSSGKAGAAQSATPGRVAATVSPRRVLSPLQARVRSPVVSPTAIVNGGLAGTNGAEDLVDTPIGICGLQFSLDCENGDLNRGVVGIGSCLWFLSNVETSRHERYAKMFPEAYELTGSQQKHQIAEDDLRHAERYRALAVEVLAMDLSGGDDSNRRDEGNESFAAELARTFNEANERADEEQRLRGAESAAQWGDLPTGSDFSSDGSDDDIGDGTLRSATSHNPLKSFSGGSAMQQQHVCPSTFVVVEMAEMVGDRSPWLLQLLGRHGGIWGYLEGTKPNIGTMVVSNTSSSLNRAGARPSIAHLRALGSVLSLSMRTGTGARASIASPLGASAHDNFVLGGTTARRSRATSAVSTVDASPHREGTRMRSKSKVDILTVAAYKPENPHSYNVRLPDIIEHPVHSARAEATQREFLMASAVVGRMQRSPTVFFAFGQGGRTPQESSLSVPGTRNVKPHPAGNRDLFDADVIAKVLQQSGGSSSDLVAQRNQSARSHTPSATSNSQRSRKGADGAGPGQDDVADINYFHEDWELMMSGQGVYNDGSPKMLRLDVARKRKQQQAAAAAAAAAAKIPTPPAKVARPVLSASSSRRLSSTLDDETPPVVAPSTARRATIVAPPMSAPMSTPFLDSVRAYLGRASVRLEVGTRKAVEELERPLTPTSASTATPSLSDASPQPPREPNNEAKLLVARRPKSGMPSSSTTGTRCALLIPPSKSTAMTVPKSPRATSARTRQHS